MDIREPTLWVFRHIGPPLSIPESVEVVELKQGAITFGRGATADVYIDSLVLRNFISRRHAVVIGERNQDGQLRFILNNSGLNGTYVNDVRIGEIYHLREGDRVTFGHKNGYKVKVGETAQQPDSEFQFVFERCQSTKTGMVPLQEHKQQVGMQGGTCLSDMDQTDISTIIHSRNGQTVSSETNQHFSNKATKKRKGSDQRNDYDDLAKLQLTVSSETSVSRCPRTDDSGSSGTKHRSLTGRGPSNVREICASKENKRTKPRTKLQDVDEGICLRRRHSDDGVPNSFWQKSEQDSPRSSSLCSDERSSIHKRKLMSASSSPKHGASPKSESPKQHERTNSLSESSGYKSKSSEMSKQIHKSRRSSFENCEHKSVSPVRDVSVDRSVSSGSASSDSRSPSPKLEHGVAESPDSISVKSGSQSPRSGYSEDKSQSPRSVNRSGSPGPDKRRSSSLYNEPPVLTPEYLKAPSSDKRVPSHCIGRNKDEVICDEVDDISRDSVFFNVRPASGRSFNNGNPDSYTSRHSAFSKRQDVSPHTKSSEFLRGKNPHAGLLTGRVKNGDTVSVSRHGTSPYHTQNNKSLEKVEKHHNSRRVNETCYNQKQQNDFSRKMQVTPIEPDSTTTTFKDRKGSDCNNDSNRKIQSRKTEKQCQKYEPKQLFETQYKSSHIKNSPGMPAQSNCRSVVKDDSDDFPQTIDRNVFEDILSTDTHRPAQPSDRKRRHSVESNGSDDGSSNRSPSKAARLRQKACKSSGEKENGLTAGRESLAKQTGCDGMKRDKQLADGHMLKDVKVSIQRVSCPDKGQARHAETSSSNRRWTFNAGNAANKNCHADRSRQPSNVTRSSKPDSKVIQERKDSSDTSLFGLEIERLGTMRLKERIRAPRTKTVQAKGQNPSSATRISREKSKQPVDKTGDVSKSSVSDRPRERRTQRIVKSRSQTPDTYWSGDETDKLKPVRKVAVRRPRQTRDNADNNRMNQKDNEQEEPRARPTRKRKRRRKKRESDEEDEDDEEEDESLEEGVTWYEEDTCASNHCQRPAERRVQWVCCDDCDSWYHTVCVGIFLEDLKEDEDYHCGCIGF